MFLIKFNENYDYDDSDVKSLEITPKIVSSKMELRIAYLVEQKEYVEYLIDHDSGHQSDITDLIKYEKNTDEWKKRQKILQKDFWLLEDYYNSIKKISINQENQNNYRYLISVNFMFKATSQSKLKL